MTANNNVRIDITAEVQGFAASMAQAQSHLDRIAVAANRMNGPVQQAGAQLTRMESSAGKLDRVLAGLATRIATVFAGWKAAEFIKDSILLSSRFETLGVVMEEVGRNAGYGREQMAAYAKGVQSMGITMRESRQAVVDMVQAQIDLSKSQQLARVAQDAAVIGQVNSSEALNRIIYGMKSGQVETLRTLGLNVDFEKSYERLAMRMGVHANTLTDAQKAQARLEATLRAGVLIQGAYEASMTTANKQMFSMQRYLEDLRVKSASVFNEALTRMVFRLVDVLAEANKKLDELAKSGKLEEWGHTVARAVEAVTNAIVPATKIAAAYFLIFKAGPVVLGTVVATLKSLQLAYAATSFVIATSSGVVTAAAGVWSLLTTSLYGTAAALFTVKTAAGALFSFIAGWQIGTWLRDSFVEVRVAGLAFVGAMLKGWEYLKYGALVAWEGIKAAWYGIMDSMRESFAGFLDLVAGGLSKLPGGGSTAKSLNLFSEMVRAGVSGYSFDAAVANLRAERDKATAAVDENIQGLVNYELGVGQSAGAAKPKAATGPHAKPKDESGTFSNDWTRAKREEIALLRLETSLLGENDFQRKLTVESQKLDSDIRKQSLTVLPEFRAQFLATAAAIKEEYVSALQEAEEASRSFETGMKTAVNSYTYEAANTAKHSERIFSNAFKRGEDAAVKFFKTLKLSAQDARDFLEGIADDIIRMFVQKQITAPLYQGMFGSGGLFTDLFGTGGGYGYEDYSGGINSNTGMGEFDYAAYAGTAHTGGVIGTDALPQQAVPARLFDGARRFHTGGMIGGDEVPIIARRGEGVFTPAQMRALGNNAPQNVRVEIVNNGTPQEVVSAQPSFDAEGMMVRVYTRDLKNGGPISRSLERTYDLRRTGGA